MISFLLLSFAIAVGVFVTNLVQAKVEETAICPVQIGFQLRSICYNGNQITYSVQNGVNTDINGFFISIIGAQEAQTIERNDLITRGGIYSGASHYDSINSGMLKQIKITPKVLLQNQQQTCSEQGIVIDSIPNC